MTLKNCHVVVIDDTSSIRSFLRISLEGQGATLSEAATAQQGIDLCHSQRPDLVVLDLGLPDRDGLEILPEIAAGDEEEQRRPTVIVLTVRNDPRTRTEALTRGARAYITKPFMMDELLEAISDYLPANAA